MNNDNTLKHSNKTAGIKSRAKKLMSLEKVWFKYPGCENYQVKDVNVIASMASRVAIVGANGAGKSTMIKVLVGENPPTKGKRWVHPEMRFAYVAQHAFHHIEQHLVRLVVFEHSLFTRISSQTF